MASQTINQHKGFRMKKLIFALVAATAAIGSAQAATPGPYVGVGIANADHNASISGATSSSSDGWKTSGKIFGGYEFDQTFGMEVGYTDFRSSDYSYTLNGVNRTGSSDGKSYYVAGKATAPVNEQFSVFGKLGAAQNKRNYSDSLLNGDSSKTELYAGVGAQYNFNPKVAVTLEYERYGKNQDIGAKSSVVTLGAKYAF
jgi:opacity protein-like surface antigen